MKQIYFSCFAAVQLHKQHFYALEIEALMEMETSCVQMWNKETIDE